MSSADFNRNILFCKEGEVFVAKAEWRDIVILR